MFKNKKVFTLLLVVAMLSSSVSIFAQGTNEGIVLTEISEEEYLNRPTENIGVSETRPIIEDEIVPFGTGIPSSTKDLSDDSYSFSGQGTNNHLYTNYSFNGADTYYIKVTNYRSEDLKFTVKSLTKTFMNGSCAANDTRYYTVKNVPESTKIYIKFLAPSSFSGLIQGYPIVE